MNAETIEIAEYAARRALEARPRPSQVTQEQAAEMLGLSHVTVRKLIRSGKIKLNGCGRIPVSEIDRVLAAA